MTTTYELKTEKFQGPLDKLLELIEEKKLEITEISLAEVTNDFLRYLQSLTGAKENANHRETSGENSFEIRENMRLLADFIAIASRLILIKSKSLLPDAPLTLDEEADIKDLEARLKIYRALKPAMRLLQGRWQKSEAEFSRPYFLNASFPRVASGANIFYPGANLSLESLVTSARRVAAVVQKFVSEEATIAKEMVSVEEKIKEIVERLQKFTEVSFSHFSGDRSRSEIIAAFLAILHMAHEQLIFLEQKSHFSDITITSNRGEATGDMRQEKWKEM
ncbi:MAG: ScpA family protein [bacterium]|nr:ScpA family protein [bacterium]